MIACPDADELLRFGSGRLDDEARMAGIAEHLNDCTVCEETLRRPSTDDFFTRHLRMRPRIGHLLEEDCERRIIAAQEFLRTIDDDPARTATWNAVDKAPSIGPYAIRGLLGRGGMGAVYRAWHTHLGRAVALKVLAPHRVADSNARERFFREMRAIGQLDHHHIVRALDADVVEGVPILVMELIDGMDLSSIVEQLGPLDVSDACEAIAQACLGLECLAERKLVHRDLKPSNLLLSKDGVVKIADLGLSRFQEDAPGNGELTGDLHVVGTADYISPEQARHSSDVDIRADIYSLGCTLFKLLAGRAPFQTDSFPSARMKLRAHAEAPAPSLSEIRPEVPGELSRLVEQMMAKAPAQRPSSPRELFLALKPWCEGSDLVGLVVRARAAIRGAKVAPASRPFESKWGGHLRKFAWAYSAALISVIVTISGFYAAQNYGAKEPLGDLPGKDPKETPVAAITPGSDKPSPTIPAAPRLRSLKDLKPLQWHRLLTTTPREAFWPRTRGLSVYHLDSEAEQLTIQSADLGLLSWGTRGAQDYQLQAGIFQHPWVGGAGLFVDFREEKALDKTSLKCQLISINLRESNRPERGFVVRRSKLEIITSLSQPSVAMNPIIDQRVPGFPGEGMLDVTIEGAKITAIQLNGKTMSELVMPELDAKFDPIGPAGEFGFYTGGNSSIVRNARVMPLRAYRWQND